jgi:DNA-binding MarR family transcriptional regulator
MARALKTQLHSVAFSAFIMNEILDNPFVDETPQSRLKQIGMMNVLYIMHQALQPLTLSNIIEITELTRSGVKESVDPLVRRGMLTETLGKNAMGRGTARQFEIAPVILEKLRSLQPMSE